MKFKKAVLFLLCAVLLFPMSVFVSAHQSLTCSCKYSMSHGKAEELYSEERNSGWKLRDGENYIKITLPRDRTTSGVTVNWFCDGSVFSIKAFSSDNTELKSYVNGELCDGISCFYPLPEQTHVIRIDMTKTAEDGEGIYSLCVCETGEDEGLKCSEPPSEGLDLLVIPTHQDDEYIFLGGIVPMFIDDGKSVGIAYAADCGRMRKQEALRGLNKIKEEYSPDFLNFTDSGRLQSRDANIEAWGGEEYIVGKFVELIRKRRPKVVVTHDTDGENYHSAHKTVSFAIQRAVRLASDPTAYPESADAYGVWTVSKLYIHLAKEYKIQLDYDAKLDTYDGLTPLQVAAEGYEEHKSQHAYYQVTRGGRWDNSLFGLAYSTVGYDTYGFFCNICDSKYTYIDGVPETRTTTTTAAPETDPETTAPQTEPETNADAVSNTMPQTEATTSNPETAESVTTEPETEQPATDSTVLESTGVDITADDQSSCVLTEEEQTGARTEGSGTYTLTVTVTAIAALAACVACTAIIIYEKRGGRRKK